MNYYCSTCRKVIVNSNICPLCGFKSFVPSNSQATIEEVNEDQPTTSQKKRRFEQQPSINLTPAEPSGQKKARAVNSSSYALVHTLGLNTVDPMGGDGAYANWLHEYFDRNRNPQGCVAVERMVYDGKKQGADAELIPLLNTNFVRQFGTILKNERRKGETGTLILNWHVRRTGRPNAWTGRGLNEQLIKELQRAAQDAGFRLLVVYTVHESEGLAGKPWCFYPTALLALNPSVQNFLQKEHANKVGLSQVPGLMTCLHTTSTDLVLHYLEGHVTIEALHTAGALLVQQFRSFNTYTHTEQNRVTRGLRGVLIFGMITGRHGTTVANVITLCKFLKTAGFGDEFKVLLAGKTQDRDLAKELQKLQETYPNLVFHGELDFRDAFNTVAGCQYAISFDPNGYRDNASAMVNVTRAGHALFSRNAGETDEQLIRRAVYQIFLCEKNPGHLISLLAAQQPRFLNTQPAAVGNRLDEFLRGLAKTQDK